MAGNSLKAAISKNMAAEPKVDAPSPKRARKKDKPPARSNTVLIGGHFPPQVKQQLRLIAAEEGATGQALLEEALDLLFAKKGKARIDDIV